VDRFLDVSVVGGSLVIRVFPPEKRQVLSAPDEFSVGVFARSRFGRLERHRTERASSMALERALFIETRDGLTFIKVTWGSAFASRRPRRSAFRLPSGSTRAATGAPRRCTHRAALRGSAGGSRCRHRDSRRVGLRLPPWILPCPTPGRHRCWQRSPPRWTERQRRHCWLVARLSRLDAGCMGDQCVGRGNRKRPLSTPP
jgi:hypothetical protein